MWGRARGSSVAFSFFFFGQPGTTSLSSAVVSSI